MSSNPASTSCGRNTAFALFAAGAMALAFTATLTTPRSSHSMLPSNSDEPANALKHPMLAEPENLQLLKRDNSFFGAKEITDFLRAEESSRQPAEDKAIETFLSGPAKRHPVQAAAGSIEPASALERFDAYVEGWLLRQPEGMKDSDRWAVAQTIADGSASTNSQNLVARKCFALLSLGESDTASDAFACSILTALYISGSRQAALALLKVALYSSDNDFATRCLGVLASGDEPAEKLLRDARDEFQNIRDIAVQNGRSPVAVAALERETSIAELHASKLPPLLDSVRDLRVAGRQSKLDGQWREFEKEYLAAWDRYSRRVESKGAVSVERTAAWGVKGGNREVDLVPLGKRVTGIRVKYDDYIYGIQFLYDGGATPWRGSDKGKEEIVDLNADEVIEEFEVKGFPSGISLIKSETNKRTIDLCKARIVDEGSIAAVDEGGTISGTPEIDLMGVPIAIGLVTYVHGDLKAFGLARQSNVEAEVGRVFTKEDFARQFPMIPELK